MAALGLRNRRKENPAIKCSICNATIPDRSYILSRIIDTRPHPTTAYVAVCEPCYDHHKQKGTKCPDTTITGT